MTWDEATTERFRQLYAEGASHSEIARDIGTTRNASIGKAHRLKLHPRKLATGRRLPSMKLSKKELSRRNAERNRARRMFLANLKGNVSDEAPPKRPQMARYRVPRVRPPEDLLQPIWLNLTLLELADNQCHHIGGNDGEYLYCGQPVWGRTAYCAYHHRVIYVLPNERERGTPNPGFISNEMARLG